MEVPAAQTETQQQQEKLRCPRCDSINTKFCYYNNYSRSQPRHFCRTCRRHWTQGGTLRTVPVGGCPRKNKRAKLTTEATGISTVQPQAELLPGNGGMESSVFPDIFRQVLFYPTPDQGGISSGNSSILFHPEFAGITPMGGTFRDEGIVIDPSPSPNVTAPSSSPYSKQSTRDSIPGDATLLSLMPGSDSMTTWIQDPSPLPVSYYWWEDTLADFAAPHPTATEAPGYPWTN